MDLICHGTPNQYILRDCIGENKLKAFRDGNSFEIVYQNEPNHEDKKYAEMYMMGFLHCLFYNQACYECPYACPQRVGDITLGDFWGLENNCAIDISHGVSVVLVNSIKGEELINHIPVCKEKRSIEEACKQNMQLTAPSKKHKYNEKFVKQYPIEGKKCLKKLLKKYRIKRVVRNILLSNKLTKNLVMRLLK